MRILVIDDDPSIRTLVQLVSKRLNHEVESVADGFTGVERARAFLPDVVLLRL